MLNEFAYCPWLAYLEWVQGEWAESADTVGGKVQHGRVDRELSLAAVWSGPFGLRLFAAGEERE
jgi:hypothetical protein